MYAISSALYLVASCSAFPACQSTPIRGALRTAVRRRIYYSAIQRSEIWDRWQAGESMSSIGRRFDWESSSVFSVISPTGGIRPPDRHRAKQALALSEREEVSRLLSMRSSLWSIARHLGRSVSNVSREVSRNGGADRYRAARSDQAAWDRATRSQGSSMKIWGHLLFDDLVSDEWGVPNPSPAH
jgi:hypothetical protein